MRKLTYFDVEYANLTNKSICQMGIICENATTGSFLYPDKDIFLNPEDLFDKNCTAVHGIDAKRVKNAQTFPQAWEDVSKYFADTIVVGYDTANDLDALTTALSRYHMVMPDLYYICTKELAHAYIPAEELEDDSLTALCKKFGIKMLTEHYAYDDALGNYDLFKKLVSTYNIEIDKHIKKFEPASDMLQVSITRFYGMLQGFAGDHLVTDSERTYIKKWREEHEQYAYDRNISTIINAIRITPDVDLTPEDIEHLLDTVKNAMLCVNSNFNATTSNALKGLLAGLIADGKLDINECTTLHNWLMGNAMLTRSTIYNDLIEYVEDILEDGFVTQEESDEIVARINALL